MKKIGKIIFLVLLVFLCNGCNGTITRNIRHAGFNLSSNEFICDELLPKKDSTNFLKMRYFMGNLAIMDDGSIYEISLDKNFSNNKNCRKAATNLGVVSIFDSVFKSNDGNIYSLVASNNNQAYSAVTSADSNYNLYKLLLGDNNIIKVQTVDNNGSYYVLKNDGNIYNYNISNNENNNYTILSSSIVYDKNNYGGSNIIDFNYAGKSLNTFFKTEDKVYRMYNTNRDSCNKFADVPCEFELKNDEIFTTYKDKILAYNGSMLITTYGNEFTVSS